MSEWYPQIVLIEKVEKHPDADSLDIATVLGDYPVIVKRDEYKVGDVACYLPIDTIVPDTTQFYFLCPVNREQYEEGGEVKSRILGPKYPVGQVPEKYRIIKAKKIRGRYSQGMLVQIPSSKFPEPLSLKVGDSVIDLFQLKKHEEEVDDNIPNAKKMRGANAASPPKGWTIPYYDIEGARKYFSCIKENEEIVITEKINGRNASFVFDGEKLWTKSRRYFKNPDPDDLWCDIAIRYNLEEKLSKYPNLVLFGELYGQVKKFRYDCELVDGKMLSKIRFFDIYDLKTQKYLDYDDFTSIIKDLNLDLAPQLYRGLLKSKEEIYALAEGMTSLGGKHVREGIVIRTVKERYESKLDSRLQLKLIGEGYNLQK